MSPSAHDLFEGEVDDAERLNALIASAEAREVSRFGRLPDEFWNARPLLRQIRAGAHARALAADAVFGALLARQSAIVHPSIHLPAVVGAEAPLSTFVALVGGSGVGKSSGVNTANALLPYDGTSVADNMPLGSGEGLIELFVDWVLEDDDTGKRVKVKRQTRYGAFVSLDEGQALTDLAGRKGSVLLPTLRTAWSGSVLGTSNASSETKRRIPAGCYSLGLVIGFQPTLAGDLLADTAPGTPQRFLWLQATDPTIPDVLPSWPGPLDWRHPAITPGPFGTPIEICESVAGPIRRSKIEVTRGNVTLADLDSHANLVRLKVAGLLAVLDHRLTITDDDYHLAGIVQRTSDQVRLSVLEAVDQQRRQLDEAATARHVRREGAVEASHVGAATERMAKAIGKHVHRATCDGPCTRRCAARATAGRDRQSATIDDALEHAVNRGWIVERDGTIRPGESRPL